MRTKGEIELGDDSESEDENQHEIPAANKKEEIIVDKGTNEKSARTPKTSHHQKTSSETKKKSSRSK